MVTWDGPTWEDYENDQRRLGLELPVDTNPDNTDPHMELWVSRAAMQYIVSAAVSCAEFLWEKDKIIAAIGSINDAVYDAFEDVLSVESL